MQWTEKYRPKNFEEIRGQEQAVAKIKEFVSCHTKNKKALVLHGPPGTGKTTLAHVIAKETNSEIFELNASDLRNKIKLKEVLRPAVAQKSLKKKNKIILIDEVDGISAVDKGGLSELLYVIESSPYPLIITANNIWDRKLNKLRKNSELVQLKEIDYKTIKDIIINISRKEALLVDSNLITNIAVKAKGDLRAAINDLQTISGIKEPSLSILDERNKEVDIFSVLKRIFKGKPTNELRGIFDSVNLSLDEVLLWLEENIPTEYQGEELAKAYEILSRADIFKRRIYKRQYWRFLVYENILLSYGISASKQNIKTGFTNYKKPTRILKIWINNQRTAKKKSITQKYAQYVHIGKKRAMQEFPIIKNILKNENIRKELKLDEKEIEYLESRE